MREKGVSKPVIFTAIVEVPPQNGKVVAAEWDFEGAGTFPVKGKFTTSSKASDRITLKSTYTFSKPETYFLTLRIASQRQGDFKMQYARIQNLGILRW